MLVLLGLFEIFKALSMLFLDITRDSRGEEGSRFNLTSSINLFDAYFIFVGVRSIEWSD